MNTPADWLTNPPLPTLYDRIAGELPSLVNVEKQEVVRMVVEAYGKSATGQSSSLARSQRGTE